MNGIGAKVDALRAQVRCWLCRHLCGSGFCNLAASREIDRLTVENERLREHRTAEDARHA